MRESINPAFYVWIIIKHIAIKIAKLRGISLESKVLGRYGNIGFDKGSVSKSYKALKILYKEDNVPIIHVFFY